VSCNSDINQWALESDSLEPEATIRGHTNNVTKIVALDEATFVSADADGRILAWNKDTGVT